MAEPSRIDKIITLCTKLPRALSPAVYEKLASMPQSDHPTRTVVWFVDDWTLEAVTTLREIAVMTLIARGKVAEAATLLQDTFDPRQPGDFVHVCEVVKSSASEVLPEIERELKLLDDCGELGLPLAFQTFGFLEAVNRRPEETKLVDGKWSCVDNSLHHRDLEQWISAHEVHDAQNLKELVEEVTGVKLG